jgi:hypothetical protein
MKNLYGVGVLTAKSTVVSAPTGMLDRPLERYSSVTTSTTTTIVLILPLTCFLRYYYYYYYLYYY